MRHETRPTNLTTRFKEIVGNVVAMQQMDPAEQTTQVFTLVHRRPELRPHEERIRAAHTEMTSQHEGQVRRLSGHPYRVHPEQVAHTVVDLLDLLGKPVTPETFIAGLHHDVWEDGNTRTVEKLVRHEDLPIVSLTEALTRHPVKKTQTAEPTPLSHDKAAQKVRQAQESGVEDAVVLKAADRIVNISDQYGVSRPPLHERLFYFLTKEYKQSQYGKWKKLKRRTKGAFTRILLHDQPELRGVLYEAIDNTQQEINQRPRKSFRVR